MNLAIRVPDDLRERICSFPFLQTLVKEVKRILEEKNKDLSEEEAESLNIHLIANKERIDVLNLLPFTAFYHELEDEDLKTVFTVHRAVKNSKLEDIDTYICLSEGFVDSSIGKSMGCPVNIGFAKGKNAFFFNKKAQLLSGRHSAEKFHEILKVFLEEAPETAAKGYSRNLDAVKEDWAQNPYTVVNLSSNGTDIDVYWREFFEQFENEKFVLVCDDVEIDKQKEIINEFVKSLPKSNELEVWELDDYIEFAKLTSFSQLFLTGDSPLANLIAYCGGKVYFMHENEDLNRNGPGYFLGDVKYFNLNDSIYREANSPAYHKVFDEVHKFLELKKKEREQ